MLDLTAGTYSVTIALRESLTRLLSLGRWTQCHVDLKGQGQVRLFCFLLIGKGVDAMSFHDVDVMKIILTCAGEK